MTKQEEMAAQVERCELLGKMAAAAEAIEQAEKDMADAKDQRAREAAMHRRDVAMGAKRLVVETLMANEQKPARIEITDFADEVPSLAQLYNRVETLKLRKERVRLELAAFELDLNLKMAAYKADRIPEMDKIDAQVRAAEAMLKGA